MSRAIRTLVSLGRISKDQFEQATLLQARRGGTMGCHLVAMGAISGDDLVTLMMESYPATLYTRTELRAIPRDIIRLLDPELAGDLRVLPIEQKGKALTLGMTDPSRQHVINEAAFQTGLEIVPGLVSEPDMDWALAHYYGISHAVSLIPEKPRFLSEMPMSFGEISEDDVDIMSIRVPMTPSGSAEPMEGTSMSTERDQDSIVMVSSDGWNLDPGTFTRETNTSLFAPSPSDFEDDLVSYLQEAPAVGQPELPMFDTNEGGRVKKDRKSKTVEREQSAGVPVIAFRPSINVGALPIAPPEIAPGYQQESSETRATRELREGEIIAAIHRAEARNDVIGLALDYVRQFAERAAFFVVKKNEIRGFEISGEFTSRSAIRSFWIPLNADCTLRQVVVERRIHLGPLGRTVADAILAASLGGRPKRVLVIPVELSGRMVGMIYGDGLHVQMPPWNRLQRLAEVVAENFKRLIIEREPR